MTSTPLKLGAYAGALALVFGAAFAIGEVTDPVTTERTATAVAHDGEARSQAQPDAEPHAGDDHAADPVAETTLPGLATSESGYTFTPLAGELPAATDAPYRFIITGPDGHPVTAYEEEHEKELHLIVVRRDFAGFQHVHPTMAADGTWSAPLDLRAAGTYRVFADFVPSELGSGLTLGTDLAVGGRYRPAALPAPAETDMVEGYQVRLSGAAEAGEETELTFSVTRDGRPVTDLQPYLGAFGHLVSLRGGDLAYLHTHPAQDAHPGDLGGPEVRFETTFPTAGSYRLFLDFKVGGQVRTAEFTVEVGGHE